MHRSTIACMEHLIPESEVVAAMFEQALKLITFATI